MSIEIIREGRRVEAVLAYCESCGSEHLAPVPCGLTFAERIRTVRTATDWMPAKANSRATDGSFIDRVALDETFGPDRREQMLEETRGLGPIRKADDGSEWVYDDPNTGAMRPLENSDLIGGYLRGE